MQIVLDMGSGNTCKNDIDYAKHMIDTVTGLDKKKNEVIFKWQLEENDPPGQRKLEREVFRAAYEHAKSKGYKTTSSVFDIPSLAFLLGFLDLPFIKIACRPDLYWLTGAIPRQYLVYLSVDGKTEAQAFVPFVKLLCIPKYPAKLEEYEERGWPGFAVSDHTPGLGLWRKYKGLRIWEKHFVLERSPDNPDSGPFAITPDQLSEVIG